MAVGNLNVYDILVDLIPGTFLILILSPLSSIDSLSIGQGIGLLLAGYVVGRLLHAIGSLGWVATVRMKLEEFLLSDYLNSVKYGLSLRNRLRNYYNEDGTLDYTESEPEEKIIRQAIDKLGGEINRNDIESHLRNKKIDDHDEIAESNSHEPTDTVLALRFWGENYLFDKNTLYLQYEITSTFYRSLWVASMVGLVIYTLVLVQDTIEIVSSSGILESLRLIVLTDNTSAARIRYLIGIMIGLIAIAYISLRQRLKFRFKKTRAFINDLHIHLPENTEE